MDRKLRLCSEGKMNGNSKATVMWITLVIMILIGAVGWVFGFTNLSASQKVNEHSEILMELKEDRATVANELKHINRRLDRIERLIEGK